MDIGTGGNVDGIFKFEISYLASGGIFLRLSKIQIFESNVELIWCNLEFLCFGGKKVYQPSRNCGTNSTKVTKKEPMNREYLYKKLIFNGHLFVNTVFNYKYIPFSLYLLQPL